MKNLYVIITTTPTRFGAVIRRFGKVKYNHAAISFDKNLTTIYAFARKKHRALLSGRLVKENLARYTLNYKYSVNCVVFEIPIEEMQYRNIKSLIADIYQDDSYIYNLFSVLSFPLFHGFKTHNAFSCIEFVMFVLKHFTDLDIPQKSSCSFKPDELLDILSPYIYYQGDLAQYMMNNISNNITSDYFEPLTARDILDGGKTLARLFYRLLFVNIGTKYR